MTNPISDRILSHVKGEEYRPQSPRRLAKDLLLNTEDNYPAFRNALKDLMHQGRVMIGAGGCVVLPTQRVGRDLIEGTYRHNRKGFGFVIPTDPESHEDLYIPEGQNRGAITGDVVRAKIVSRGHRDGKQTLTGRIEQIVQRTHKRFVGELVKQGGHWIVMPEGNVFTTPIEVADAPSRHVRPGTKVCVEITTYPEEYRPAQGVITEVLGLEGEKDVDLKSVIIQHNLPADFPEEVLDQARHAVDTINWDALRTERLDLSSQTIVTIDPDDAKDYDDAIGLRQVEGGNWELGVHIADVAHFVPEGSALDREAAARGNSAYFPGHVIPMLPEILSNGVCSLQEGVPRLCKSAFITLDDHGRPIRTRFANTLIRSAKRLRYREAQALIDHVRKIPHPEGDRNPNDYTPEVRQLLHEMDALAKRIQKRRLAAGQLVLELPVIKLVLDDQGKVTGAEPEDTSYTHTMIEMFMVEANEAVARLLDRQKVPFIRRVHPGPGEAENTRLREFANVVGYKLPKELDRKALQTLLDSVRAKPESYAINLALLKSLTRAEYSPEPVGHFALASEFYTHFTSPIRRYADLMIHRLLQRYLEQSVSPHRKGKVDFAGVASYDDLVTIGRQISFTERRAEAAERELRQVKVLTLLQDHVGETFQGVVTGITNFGVFTQIREWLIEGLTRYDNLMDDWWDVNEAAGTVRGQRTGLTLRIGDVVKARIAKVDIARRELDIQLVDLPRPKKIPQEKGKFRPEQERKQHRKSQRRFGGRGRH